MKSIWEHISHNAINNSRQGLNWVDPNDHD
jgi:hypothetical protein